MRRLFFLIVTAVILRAPLVYAPVLTGAQHPAYDEMIDAKTGQPFPQYRALYELLQKMTPEQKEEFSKRTQQYQHISNKYSDVAFGPEVKIVTPEEWQEQKQGMDQLARMFGRLLQAQLKGDQSFLKSHGGPVPDEEWDIITKNTTDRFLSSKIDPNNVAFVLAPDLIRIKDETAPKGYRYIILEVNSNDVGGPGIIGNFTREMFEKLNPEYKKVMNPNYDADNFYREWLKSAADRADPPGSKVVLAASHPYESSMWVNFERKMKKLAKEMNIDFEIVSADMRNKKLEFDFKNKKAYVRYQKGSKSQKEQVGSVILGDSIFNLDLSNPIVRSETLRDLVEEKREALEAANQPDPKTGVVDEKKIKEANALNPLKELEALKKNSFKDLLRAIQEGIVRVDQTPGSSGYMDNKRLAPYLSDLITFFLKEPAVFQSLPVSSDLEEIRKNPADWVIKGTDDKKSYGGKAVTVGKDVSKEEFERAVLLFDLARSGYLGQGYRAPSTLDGGSTDLRTYAFYTRTNGVEKIVIPQAALSRFAPVHGNRGLMNVSSGAKTIPVVYYDEACMKALADSIAAP